MVSMPLKAQPSVLIIEDEPRLRDLLARALPPMGFTPTVGATPKRPSNSWKPRRLTSSSSISTCQA